MTTVLTSSQPAISQLPELFAIELSDFSAISLTGEEQSKYLQGQVTCDVESLAELGLLHGSHCDAKGKVYSVFRLINHNNAHLLLQPKSSITASLAALKKFGVFAKVDIEQANALAFAAIVGQHASEALHQHFEKVPDSLTPVVQNGSTSIVYIAGQCERFLLIDNAETIEQALKDLNLPVYGQAVWSALEIKEGFPQLAEHAISEYVPQMLNVQAIHGISFTKGCYLGQETVARMQYLGKNKRALFALAGTSSTNIAAGDIVEKQLGENWRKAGDITSLYQAEDSSYLLQVVLANDVDTTTKFRLKTDPNSTFTIVELPYSLT